MSLKTIAIARSRCGLKAIALSRKRACEWDSDDADDGSYAKSDGSDHSYSSLLPLVDSSDSDTDSAIQKDLGAIQNDDDDETDDDLEWEAMKDRARVEFLVKAFRNKIVLGPAIGHPCTTWSTVRNEKEL